MEFIEEVLGGKPWAAQREIALSVLEHPLTVVRSANGVGKDWVGARLALWHVYARGGLVLVIGAKQQQTREIVMTEVADAFSSAGDLPGKLFQSALRISQESKAGILAMTSTSASRLTGFHGAHVMGIMTEAQEVPGFAWEALQANAIGENDRLLALGNPLEPTGQFHSACQSDAWHEVVISARNHPNVQQGETVIPGGPTRHWVNLMAKRWGEDSRRFQSRVEGEFPDAGEDSLFRRSWLDQAAKRHEEGTIQPPDDALKTAGIDVARGGDKSVVCIRRGPVVERLEEFSFSDTVRVEAKITEILEEEGFRRYEDTTGMHPEMETVVVDVGGPGGGVADHLADQGFDVAEYLSGASPVEQGRYRNARAESYWMLRKKLEAGSIAIPQDDELVRELLATSWFQGSGGKTQLESKKDIRKKLGRSPDRADALVMCFYADYLDSKYSGTTLAVV